MDTQTKEKTIVDIYTAKLLTDGVENSLYPPAREQEVLSCKNEMVRRQKYSVWQLLGYALAHTFGYKIQELTFTKNAHGKWETPACYFSLSHTVGAVAVAVSNKAVGVDVEPLSSQKTAVMEKSLTGEELSQFLSLSKEAKTKFLIEKWTGKESIFKTQDLPRFRPETIDVASYPTQSKIVEIDGIEYVLSVSAQDLSHVRYFEDVVLKRE